MLGDAQKRKKFGTPLSTLWRALEPCIFLVFLSFRLTIIMIFCRPICVRRGLVQGPGCRARETHAPGKVLKTYNNSFWLTQHVLSLPGTSVPMYSYTALTTNGMHHQQQIDKNPAASAVSLPTILPPWSNQAHPPTRTTAGAWRQRSRLRAGMHEVAVARAAGSTTTPTPSYSS